MSPSAARLAHLLRRSADGDREAFAQFYDETVEAVFRLALLLDADRERAELLVVRVYLHAWREAGRQSFDGVLAEGRGSSPLCWVLVLTQALSRELDADPDGAGPSVERETDQAGPVSTR